MDEKVIKLSEAELKEIAIIQDSFRKAVFEIGQCELMIKEIQIQKDDMFNNLAEIHKHEEKFITDLTGKYGDGFLNIKEGTFKLAPPEQNK